MIMSTEENVVVTEGRDIVHQFYDRYDNCEVDLVFVLDRSASVTHAGWRTMTGFVRSLLEHFTVSSQNTRVAIVTFASRVSVDINDLAEGRSNKCSLVSQIRRRLGQKVPSGFTATYDALIRVSQILLSSRPGAKKGVFVLTDGKSNIGPPPVRASVEIRYLRWNSSWSESEHGPQVEIYAFGVKDAYMPELRSVASALPNHTFFLPNFTTFEQLARSLHNDRQCETWEVVRIGNHCYARCSAQAYCTCATRTGEYVCVCQEGFQGDGYTCTPCPKGTFKDSLNPYNCQICPSNSTTLSIGATSINHCTCQQPYHQMEPGGPCVIMECPPLPQIANGLSFFVPGRVRDEVPNTNEPCQNLPDTSCHYRCNHGYRLDTHPGLICEHNGTWSGVVPECKIVDCLSLDYHHQSVNHGTVVYNNNNNNNTDSMTTFGSTVTVTCDPGWKLFGDSVRTCTQYGVWSGTPAWCSEALCPALNVPEGASVHPLRCSETKMMPGSVCEFSCHSGFLQGGPRMKTCSPSGSWDTLEAAVCEDVTPPNITCPSDIRVPVDEEDHTVIHWKSEQPIVSDNSGTSVSVVVIGATRSPRQFSIGYHQLKYVARDKAGNENFCIRTIHVVAKIIRIVTCPSNVTLNDVPGNDAVVTWSEPVFMDNNNNTVDYQCSRNSGDVFRIGTHNIHCSSKEGNKHCYFTVTLIRKTCVVPPPPLHGSVTCHEGAGFLKLCSVSCNDNYDFYYLPQQMYKCDLTGTWILRKPNTFWPPCSRVYNPSRVKMRGSVRYHYYRGECDNIRDQIAERFVELIQRNAWKICGDSHCNIPISEVTVHCGNESRKKRNAEQNDTGEFQNLKSTYSDDVMNDSETENGSESTQLVEESERSTDGEEITTELPPFVTETYQTLESSPLTTEGSVVQNSTAEQGQASVQRSTANSSYMALTLTFDLHVDSKSNVTSEQDQVEMINLLYDYMDILDEQVSRISLTTNDSDDSVIQLLPEGKIDFGEPEFSDCKPGQITKQKNVYTHSCVFCPVGTYYEDASCVECPVGHYQDKEGQLQCHQCPDASTTFHTGAVSVTECSEPCQSGYYSDNGLEPCTACPVGYYSDNTTSTSCTACPEMTSTVKTGAESSDDCKGMCYPGYYSSVSGLEPCDACAVNTYQPEEGATSCVLCPNNTVTLQTGSDSDDLCIDPCTNAMCGSHGSCVGVSDGDVVCSCDVGFTGKTCDVNIDDCLSSLCSENSTCVDQVNDFTCICQSGFTGKRCDLDIDECLSSPCGINGSCEDFVGGYQCYCSAGFTGTHCETTQECTPEDCRHGNGVFQDGFCSCSCLPGYAGVSCDVLIDQCSTRPCQNFVTCSPLPNDFTCQCLPGFTGKFCDFEINECSSSPCQNGGQCFDRINSFICKCVPGFAGQLCQTEVSRDFDLVFENPTSSAFVSFPWETIPVMTEVAVCFWVRTNQMTGFGTVFSYTVQQTEFEMERVNEFTLADIDGLKFYVGGELIDTGVHLSPRVWNSVCVMWSSNRGVWSVTVNTTTAASGVNINTGNIIVGGGSFIIGQKQGIKGEAYNFWESFVGEITQFNMYGHVDILQSSQSSLPHNCSSLDAGDIIAWTSVIDGVRGPAQIRNTSHCLDINECQFPDVFPCGFRRHCEDLIGSYRCTDCMYGYYGDDCSLPVDECNLNVCRNGAWCVDGPEPNDTTCTCQNGYTGEYCESEIDFCESRPCLNNGTCTNVVGVGYHCDCPRQNMGDNCEQIGDACWQNPCQNGGSCVANGNSFRCLCREGYVGNFCEKNTKYCQTNPCLNSGLCIIHRGHQKCICPAPWRGRFCEVTLVPDCAASPCLNGGTCFLSPNSIMGYRCQCPSTPGVTWDLNCGYANPCDSGPCFNNGLCIHLLNNTFRCSCPVGFWGMRCQIDLSRRTGSTSASTTTVMPRVVTVSPCSQVHCQNEGTCVEIEDSFSCRCSDNYGGIYCEVEKQMVVKTYMVSLVLNKSFNIIHQNEAVFSHQFKNGMIQLLNSQAPGNFKVDIVSTKADRDEGKTTVNFHLTHTQYVTRLSDLFNKNEMRRLLWTSLKSGTVAEFPASQDNFLFDELKSGELHKSSVTVYLSVGVVGLLILLIASVTFFIIYSRRHRRSKSLFDRVNNSPDLVLNMINNPEELHSHRSSCNEENTYADLGDTVLPYEVTHRSDLETFGRNSSKRGLKECNLDIAAAQKAMNVPTSTTHSSDTCTTTTTTTTTTTASSSAESDNYLHPIVSKNDVGSLETARKDDKQLLPIGSKGGHVNMAFDKDLYLLPRTCEMTSFSSFSDSPRKHDYVNESNKTETSDCSYVPFQPLAPSYVNQSDVIPTTENNREVPQDKNMDTKDHLSETVSDAVKSAESKSCEEHDEDEDYTEPKEEPPEEPPDYLEVMTPETEDLPPADPAKRKLPPLPPNAVLFAQSKK